MIIHFLRTFNRTIVELKYTIFSLHTVQFLAFNRTIVELKFFWLYCANERVSSFNRTIVELKFGMKNRLFMLKRLLIVP